MCLRHVCTISVRKIVCLQRAVAGGGNVHRKRGVLAPSCFSSQLCLTLRLSPISVWSEETHSRTLSNLRWERARTQLPHSASLPHSLTHSFIPFLTHAALPRHPTQSPLPAPPTAYYNLHGGALSRLASDNMCAGETERLAEHDGGSERAVQLLLVFI